ncbi:hypothetical protein TcYC6_0005140 [Trypanosoma cruzi]|nr:hypothetical protein TcYC6_0005140 [Trypanosoma cruzi]
MTTCRNIQVCKRLPRREIHDDLIGIIQVAAVRPDERYMTTNRLSTLRRRPRTRDIMTTNRSIHAAAAAPYERYMTTNRGYPRCGGATLNMSLSFSRGHANVLDVFERSNLQLT